MTTVYNTSPKTPRVQPLYRATQVVWYLLDLLEVLLAFRFVMKLLGANAAARTANVYQLGGSYDFGVAKLAATYLNGKNGGTATSLASTKFRAYQVGVSAPFGAIVPFITFGRGKSTNETTNLLSEDYKSAQIGVRYSLSKRTTAYAFYGRTTNEAAAATALYRDSKALVGVAHSF